MNTYRYPENLAAKAILWLWYLRDIGIIGVGAILAVLLITQAGFFPPIIIVAIYAFLTIRVEDTSILDFILYACSFFVFKQQFFEWNYAGRSVQYDRDKGKHR